MRRLRSVVALGVILAVGWLGGCRRDTATGVNSESPPGASPASKTVGVSVLTMTNPFFIVIADNLRDEAEKNGYQVNIQSGEFDVARQQNQVKDFIVDGVAAIVLCPCDSKSIGPAITEANQAGIPVFTADIACLAPGPQVVSHIATDNYAGGKQAAAAMIEALGGEGGKIVILDFKQAESCIMRVQGFHDAIEAYNRDRKSPITIVAELPGDGLKDRGYKMAEDALQAYPDLVGIFAINDPSALGARAALEKAGKADQVVIIGFDGQPEGRQAIKDGKIYADPIQFPDQIGRQTVQAIVRYFQGEEVPPKILIPPKLYRKADAEADPTLN